MHLYVEDLHWPAIRLRNIRSGGDRPERLAETLVTPFELTLCDHPVKLPEVQINMFWHAKVHREPANQWLRNLVFDLFGTK